MTITIRSLSTIKFIGLLETNTIGYVLSDSSGGDLSRPRCPAGVVRARTRECTGGFRDLPRAPGSGCCAVASTLQGDFACRSGLCRYGPDGPSRPPWLAWADTDQEQLLALSTRVSP